MKYPFAILGIMLFGMFGLVFIVMFESITIDNEAEYYVLKEAMEAAMLESVDVACFRNVNVNTNGCYGELKISESKFVENFTRRFANSITGDASSYTIEFYDIIEMPPKATVKVTATTGTYQLSISDSESANIVNNLTGILETEKTS